jgi:hypothetical protein
LNCCSLVDKVKKEIEQLIYEFVYSLGTSVADPERSKEYSYYRGILSVLSEDNKFIKAVQQIYDNRHKVFERGYNMLINNHQIA